jgi:7-cyano-7-deazaguanine synthase
MSRAVVLLSGGMDSAVTLALAAAENAAVHALSFGYGQRHARELDCAEAQARAFQVHQHRIVELDFGAWARSALTGHGAVPLDREAPAGSIPPTYVPARNTLFLAYALAWAEVLEAPRIYLGANAVDYSGYPDCRPEFLQAFEQLANLATRAAVEGRLCFQIRAPLLRHTKAEIVRLGADLGVDFGLTHSCYDPGAGGAPCERCDACHLRAKGFAAAGILDPLSSPRGGG